MIDTTTALGDLVTEDPRRARVLEDLGLDFCCHGSRSLAEASQEKGLDVAAVAAALDLPDREEAPEWQSLGLAALADHIVAVHHAYLWDELGPLGTLVDKVYSVHGERHPGLAGVRNDYVALSGPLLVERGFHERELARRTERFGHIAHVFSTYEGKVAGDAPPMRGINTIQLMNDGRRWWIVSLMWEAESPKLGLPAEYLPTGPARDGHR